MELPARAFIVRVRNLPPESRIVKLMSEIVQEKIDDGSWWREAFDTARGMHGRVRHRRSVEWLLNEVT